MGAGTGQRDETDENPPLPSTPHSHTHTHTHKRCFGRSETESFYTSFMCYFRHVFPLPLAGNNAPK